MNSWSSTLRASLLGGLAAGVAAAVFSVLLLEPTIRLALKVEDARNATTGAHEHGHEHESELVSRGTQVVGGVVAILVTALLLSLVYAVALALVRRRSRLSGLQAALAVAGIGFVVFALVPGLRYPANPPAVGDPATVNIRTVLYLASIVMGALLVASTVAVRRTAVARRWSPVRQSWALAATVGVGLTVIFVGLPASPDAIPEDVPAGLIWGFRLQSMAMLVLLWTAMGLVTGSRLQHQTRGAQSYERRSIIAAQP